ncbi:CMGC/CK2 protein kinase [Thecamonas trahens ATCC 50062]|uniref:non-specific serine/threonine protein kinase n=1 Tax=Thecamonas trahens ATCC 50062 TaxID=461836 RepID=A0A0L0DQZ2_THETB|nr:CMGC/CK2 protein kinase [Thecamonas trahens ATCC 50062]KNC54690.1 CMGC/CK2 protein kinase [Thecamonas trahens ATCC 50062]|eukprot:XP_013761592.1 CMGC/CK2 protein kinase [Thecamonas trahens ATCC 50062]
MSSGTRKTRRLLVVGLGDPRGTLGDRRNVGRSCLEYMASAWNIELHDLATEAGLGWAAETFATPKAKALAAAFDAKAAGTAEMRMSATPKACDEECDNGEGSGKRKRKGSQRAGGCKTGVLARVGRKKLKFSSPAGKAGETVSVKAEIVLVSPTAYLVSSGHVLKTVLELTASSPGELLVLYPDLRVTIGKYRSYQSGTASHPGLPDLYRCLESTEFPRFGIGINGIHKAGPTSSWDNFIATEFEPHELAMFEVRTLVRVKDGVGLLLAGKLDPPEPFELVWENGDHYVCGDKVGEGKFGAVFKAVDTRDSSEVVLKMLKKTRDLERKIAREVEMLMAVRSGPNIVRLLCTAVIEDEEYRDDAMVFEFVSSISHRDLFAQIDLRTARVYMYKLLKAVEYTHSLNILHLDIKPSNVLYNPQTTQFRLADWGLAARWQPGVPNYGPLGTRCYKAPELCLRYDLYGPPVDIWAIGCTLAAMLFLPSDGRNPFIRARGSWLNQLVAITEVVSSDVMFAYLDKYRMGVHLLEEELELLRGHPAVAWEDRVTPKNAHMADPAGFELVAGLLTCDHESRWTATQALASPFFDPVRNEIEAAPPL